MTSLSPFSRALRDLQVSGDAGYRSTDGDDLRIMLDLHVWGAAFGLPSIDPECLAIITYIHNALPAASWRLIPSNDPSVSPSSMFTLSSISCSSLTACADLLPALNHDGTWTSGYGPILGYLSSKSLCKDLDETLSPAQHADRVAFSAYLAAHAAPLLDLSLYASAANWAATTRPAYSALLTFPLTWTVPPLIRAAALKRVEHLGMADLDTDFDPSGAFHISTGRDLPESFRRHIPLQTKKSVREEMTPEQAAAIRLFGLAEDCLSVVDGLMAGEEGEEGSPRFFSGTTLSSLDCLAFGYLALMRDAPVPRCFLQEWLTQKTPRLSNFVDDMASTCLQAPGDLPWTPAPQSAVRAIVRTLDTAVRSMPSLGEHYANELRTRAEKGTKGLDQRTMGILMGFMMTGAAVGYGLQMYRTLQPFGARYQVWKRKDGSRLGEFGALGDMLSAAMGPAPSLSATRAENTSFSEVD